MKTFTVREDTTLKKFTDDAYAQASFCFRTLLKERNIRVNGKRVASDVALKKGDAVQYFLTPSQDKKLAFSVLYEDENVTVVDKESGVSSEAVFAALCEAKPCYFIHRLDRNTEGVMIFANTPSAEDALLTAFREKRTEKVYHALVIGHLERRHAVEEAYLLKDEGAACVSVSREKRGEKIVTEYEVMGEKGEFSLLKVTLHTGKTHQIRAHLAFLGHPVLGDEKYGDGEKNRHYHATRQRLLAKELTLFLGGSLGYLNGKSYVSPKNLQFPPENA